MKIINLIRNGCIILLTIILVGIVVAIMLLTATKNMISKDNIADYIKKSDILELKIGTLFNINNDKIDKNTTFRKSIIILADQNGIPKKVVDDLIETNELNKVLGDLLNSVIYYAIVGGEKPVIATYTVERFTQVANKSLESHIGIVMEPEELNKNITSYLNELISNVPNRELLIKDINKLDAFKQILTFNIIYLYISVALILSLLALLMKSWYFPLKQLGIIILSCGVSFAVIGSLEWPIYNLLKGNVPNMEAITLPLIQKVLSISFEQGVIYTVIGIFIIIAFVVINRFVKNKKKLDL